MSGAAPGLPAPLGLGVWDDSVGLPLLLLVVIVLALAALGVLAVQLGRQRRALAEANARLEDANRTLEERVATRVAEAERSTRMMDDFNDLLEEKNVELEAALADLQTTQDRLLKADRLASLGQLMAGIAHEIKNPLNFVTNFARLSVELAEELREELEARREAPVGEALAEVEEVLDDLAGNAARIEQHAHRADNIVRNMLLHSREAPGQPQLADLNALVEEYAGLAYHGMRAADATFNAELVHDLDAAVGEVSVRPQEIGGVLINLLSNAFHAVRERAREGAAGYAPRVTVRTLGRGEAVEIHVEDNGIGIPDDMVERIFEPFVTTKPAGEGTGLGLSLAYEVVVQKHGGELDVETGEGRGAVFTITLPRTAGGTRAPASGGAPRVPPTVQPL